MSDPISPQASERSGQQRPGDVADPGTRRVRMLLTLPLGTVAMAAVVLIVSWGELVTGKIMIGFLQLPPVVLPLLFLVIVVNGAIRRRFPRLALSAPELTLLFVMVND